MSLGLAFWIGMFIWLIFGLWSNWPAAGQPRNFRPAGGALLLFILLVFLGWHAFGPPIKP